MQRQRFARRDMPVAFGLVLLGILACQFLSSQSPTMSVVLARDVRPDTLDPVEVTDTYSWDQPQFHALVHVSDAPVGTLVRVVWTAIDVRGTAPPNTQITETEKKVQGNQRLDFTAVPDFGQWPPGSYKLDVYLNGKLDQTISFAVVAPTPTPAPVGQPASVCPPIPVPILTPSVVITGVMMALDAEPETKEPVHPTTAFPPSAVFHVVVGVEDAPPDTTITATWYASDLGDISSCNTKLTSTDILVDVSRNIDFSLASKIPWPAGRYRVEIAVNRVPAEVMTFEVVP